MATYTNNIVQVLVFFFLPLQSSLLQHGFRNPEEVAVEVIRIDLSLQVDLQLNPAILFFGECVDREKRTGGLAGFHVTLE